jgi:hypothetical protein
MISKLKEIFKHTDIWNRKGFPRMEWDSKDGEALFKVREVNYEY